VLTAGEGTGPVPGTGRPLTPKGAGCKCKRSANHGGAAGFRETPPAGSKGD